MLGCRGDRDQGQALGARVRPVQAPAGLMNGFQFYCHRDELKGFEKRSSLVDFMF